MAPESSSDFMSTEERKIEETKVDLGEQKESEMKEVPKTRDLITNPAASDHEKDVTLKDRTSEGTNEASSHSDGEVVANPAVAFTDDTPTLQAISPTPTPEVGAEPAAVEEIKTGAGDTEPATVEKEDEETGDDVTDESNKCTKL